MNCPRCKAEIPATAEGSVGKAGKADKAAPRRMPEPEDAVPLPARNAGGARCGMSDVEPATGRSSDGEEIEQAEVQPGREQGG